MKLTNQEIINTINGLQSIEEKELPILLTYRVIDNLEKLLTVYESYSKTLDKAKTEKEIKELLGVEKEVDIEPINKQELIDANISLSPVQLVSLKRIIDG